MTAAGQCIWVNECFHHHRNPCGVRTSYRVPYTRWWGQKKASVIDPATGPMYAGYAIRPTSVIPADNEPEKSSRNVFNAHPVSLRVGRVCSTQPPRNK